MKKILAINAGPRTGWNTDQLIRAAARGAEENGAEVEYIDLFKLEKYTGCVSCFGCKLPKTFGTCVRRDGLYDVLQKIATADGIIIGSPNYLGDLTASFRALYERLIFRSLTYNVETPNCNEHRIPVLLIMTSNCSEDMYEAIGYQDMLDRYAQNLSRFVGPTQLFTYGNTLQVDDYSKYNWTMFDPEAKKAAHDALFDSYIEKAHTLGAGLETVGV